MPMQATRSAVSALNARPFLRNKGMAVFATAATVTGLAFKYTSSSFNKNELDQRLNKAPNAYVTVDRSGGGI